MSKRCPICGRKVDQNTGKCTGAPTCPYEEPVTKEVAQ